MTPALIRPRSLRGGIRWQFHLTFAMSKSKRHVIEVQGASIAVLSHDQQDFICLTDIAKLKNPDHSDDVIRNWLRSRGTVEFLGVWERLNNSEFNPVEFAGIRKKAG